MQNRIKELRKHLGLNQTEFGARIGVKQTTVAGYEGDNSSVPDAIIKSIVREYGVSETWLRTGAGEMYRPRSREAELGAAIRAVFVDRPESFQAALISVLLRFDPDGPEWAVLERIAAALTEEAARRKKDNPEP
ncbi:MAG: helix-turn-helix transcriptional regulator [Firmicutes bacterium]|nr:helix-turn-helix transcriptional regulator [Bacillota bacterium]